MPTCSQSKLEMRQALSALQASRVLQFHKLVDRTLILVADQKPMEAVIDMDFFSFFYKHLTFPLVVRMKY